jgi:hypothetical protein
LKHIQITQEIIKKYEIVLKQQLDTVSYLEEQKISAGFHPETKNRACLYLEKLNKSAMIRRYERKYSAMIKRFERK